MSILLYLFLLLFMFSNFTCKIDVLIQGASRETDVFEMDITEQVERVEACVGGN
jgi:hypothetical protein